MDVTEIKRRLAPHWHRFYRGMNPTATFDRAQWFDAAMQREQVRPPKPKAPRLTVEDRQYVINYLNKKNFVRMRRLRREMRWVRRHLIKLGIDPREAGYYL